MWEVSKGGIVIRRVVGSLVVTDGAGGECCDVRGCEAECATIYNSGDSKEAPQAQLSNPLCG